MGNLEITCYFPGSEPNLFKIKSICSFHSLCSTSSQQSTVDYSITLKIGCNYDKLITLILWFAVARCFGEQPSFPLFLKNNPAIGLEVCLVGWFSAAGPEYFLDKVSSKYIIWWLYKFKVIFMVGESAKLCRWVCKWP